MGNQDNPLARHGGLSYLEVPTLDGARSAAFYGSVLGWQIDRRSAEDFRFAAPDGLFIGRFAPDRAVSDGGIVPAYYVDGLAGGIERAVAAGGQIVRPAQVEGDTNIVRLRDPSGNSLVLWEFLAG